MLILPDDVNSAVQQSANDMASALQNVNNFAFRTGGKEMAKKAMREVEKFEFFGVNTFEACQIVYNQIAEGTL